MVLLSFDWRGRTHVHPAATQNDFDNLCLPLLRNDKCRSAEDVVGFLCKVAFFPQGAVWRLRGLLLVACVVAPATSVLPAFQCFCVGGWNIAQIRLQASTILLVFAFWTSVGRRGI